MNRSELTKLLLQKYGGETNKENGHWFWSNNGQKHLISNEWLQQMLSKKEETVVEIQQHQNEIVVENVGIETPVEKQEPKNKSTALSEEEIKEMKKQKRKEQRLKRKLKKQQNEES
jgi:hypothetical protein